LALHILVNLTASCLVCTPLLSQVSAPPIVADDFNDGVIGSEWITGITIGSWVEVDEGRGVLEAGGSSLLQSAVGIFYLVQDLVTPFVGEFELVIPLTWTADPLQPLASTSQMTVALMDQNGHSFVSWEFDDQNIYGGGDFRFNSNSDSQTLFGMPNSGSAILRLTRDAANNVSFQFDGPNGIVEGSLGDSTNEVHGITITFQHNGSGSPPFTTLALDELTLTNQLLPFIRAEGLEAGAMATLEMTRATPMSMVLFGFSLAGAGPSNTPYGVLDLSHPIVALSSTAADASGFASLSVNMPSNSSGRSIWLQGIDLDSGRPSNGLEKLIL